ncbi:histidine kinase [Actinoallomurus spadix]|uniref:histidine kinase n=2 Tax=Actinoallomurus spadix TaxID=79912 RepID=A0ABN0XU54_9ACTN
MPDRVLPIGRWWRARGLAVRDGALAALFAALAFTPGVAHEGMIMAENVRRPVDGLALVLLFAQCVPLAGRRIRPGTCLTVIAAAFAVHEILGYPPTFASEGLIVALYSVGAYQDRFRRVPAVAGIAGYVVLVVVVVAQGSPERPADFVAFFLIVYAGSWSLGAWMRARTRQEAEHRRQAAGAAIREERARIARELHDVVTHHVTNMVIRADATTFLATDSPKQVVSGLTEIGETGRRTLAELRYFLGVLDPVDDEPEREPAVGALRDLVEETRSTGQPIELSEVGEQGPMTRGAELAAYRVVQESLTNALKHAPGRRTVVRVRHDAAEVDIEVSTDGSHGSGGAAPRSADGRGLTGLRERVSVVGGELRAGVRPDGGFTVHARIPAGGGR